MVTTPSHEAQDREGATREVARNAPGTPPAIPEGETDTAVATPMADAGPQDAGGEQPAPSTPQPQSDAPRPPPKVRGLYDDKRAGIIDRFRTARVEEAKDAADDISEFARSGMPPEFASPPLAPAQEPESGEESGEEIGREKSDEIKDLKSGEESGGQPVRAPTRPEPARTVKLKVRGQEIEVPLEEALGKAQIAYAAENYLDEARSKLKEADALAQDIRARAQRPAQDGQHQPAKTTQPSEPARDAKADPQHPEEKPRLTEIIQFGDPDEAERRLADTIAQAADQRVKQALYEQRLQDEGARTARVLAEFRKEHADIDQDPRARAAIEVTMLELQAEDLKAVGLDPNNLRPDGNPTTPADVSAAHRHYRAMGMNVRSPEEMLNRALGTYQEWRGIKPEQPASSELPKAAPRIEVSVNRQERRAAVQQQPSRTAVPRRPAAEAAPERRDGSSVVNAMKARNATLRGQNLGL